MSLQINLTANIVDQKKPSNRPLSASRVRTKTAMDTEEEASAVLEALRAENEQASKLKKEAPRKLPPTPKKVPLSEQHTKNILLLPKYTSAFCLFHCSYFPASTTPTPKKVHVPLLPQNLKFTNASRFINTSVLFMEVGI